MTELLTTITETRERFMELVAEVRPELHRYCARMTGSVFDGEDVVQETLAKAYYALAEMESPPPLRPWLFRIAYNTSMDFLRRYEHRNVESAADMEVIADMHGSPETEEHTPDDERVEAALTVFAALPPVQRSALALKDVLGLSLEETAATMEVSVPAVKGALTRARANVASASASGRPGGGAVEVERLRRYADLFNARDWDGLRALFGEETRLDVVSRYQRHGSSAGQYFTRYCEIAPREDLRLEAGWVDGVPAIAVFRPATSSFPAYFIRIDWRDDRVAQVRDFRYVPYIAGDATFRSVRAGVGNRTPSP
ncbi:MAG TPA: sigma-70 family RNA polymerase sigma factor [Myxococcaceae bacterium]|nr:sigma-70 family RNA polymerase sigma factor [Myxococcaceae bacterium]